MQIVRAYEQLEQETSMNDQQRLTLLQPHLIVLCLNQTGSKFLQRLFSHRRPQFQHDTRNELICNICIDQIIRSQSV